MASSKKFPPGTNMRVEKREERTGKDYDHDGERNEPAAHVRKVRAAAAASAKIKGKVILAAKGKAACAKCKAKGMKTCAHG